MSEPFLGEIRAFGFNFSPRGWAPCDGQLLSIASNTALFSLLGTTYGGDGRTTFALPDLQGRVAMHYGSGAGLSPRPQGQKSGSETNTLVEDNLPAHTHGVTAVAKCVGGAGNSNDAVNNVWADDLGAASATYSSNVPTGNMNASAIETTCSSVGNNTSVNNMQPYLVVNYCIAVQGIFPARS
jgi:microcystin-dependent protein